MNVKWYLSDTFACGHVRGEVLARETNKRKQCRIDCKTDVLISDFYGTDLMIFQRSHSSGFLDKLRLAKSQGIKTVYEIDDDLLNTPKEFKKPYDFYSKPEVRDILTAFMTEADAITASTDTLALAVQQKAERTPIFVVENYLDVERWDMAFAKRQVRNDDTITIGWMASGSHAIDAEIVLPAIQRIMQEHSNVKLHLIGWVGWNEMSEDFGKMKSRITVQDWVEISSLPLSMTDFDIGIAACIDNPFNESKSAIKAFQYWSLGVPVVASCIPEYQSKINDGEDGFVCDDSEWYDKLKILVEDENKRKLMGAQGRFKLLSNYDIRNNVGQWTNAFDTILGI